MQMTRVVVYAQNYTGANFRGFADPSDGVDVKATLQGQSNKIAAFILANFSYGSDDDSLTLDKMIEQYESGDVPQFDGCGGVYKIEDVNGRELFYDKDYMPKAEFKRTKWRELGVVDVDQYETKETKHGGTEYTGYDVVNHLV